jgi:hypothetical protein
VCSTADERRQDVGLMFVGHLDTTHDLVRTLSCHHFTKSVPRPKHHLIVATYEGHLLPAL